jgi:hypothetical protein
MSAVIQFHHDQGQVSRIAKGDPVGATTSVAISFTKITAPGFVGAAPGVLSSKSILGYPFNIPGTVIPSAKPQGHFMTVLFVHFESAVEFDYFHALIIAYQGFLVKLNFAKYSTMPKLSLYRPNRTRDYQFMDRTISEMYTVGGLDLFVHKYMGPQTGGEDSATSGNFDATQPIYDELSPLNIQDLLLLENRDRIYDQDVYVMRGVYQTQDVDFDLSQFGLFLNNDTLFITFHYNDMIDSFGRKLMNGDVLEVPNLKDYNPLNTAIPVPLPKYYMIQDAAFASEGFAQTWQPHTWRVKATPMTNAQEVKDILKAPVVSENIWDDGNFYPTGSVVNQGDVYYRAVQNVPAGTAITNSTFWTLYTPLTESDVFTTRPKDQEINDAILLQADIEVPLSGYDTQKFYIEPTINGAPANPTSLTADGSNTTVDGTQGGMAVTPSSPGYTRGYLTGDAVPNGLPVTTGIAFPLNPVSGDYVLRLDYKPNRLFRYDGRAWVKIEDGVRTDLNNGPNNKTQRSGFVNNTDTVRTTDRGTIPSRQSLSEILKPRADNGG